MFYEHIFTSFLTSCSVIETMLRRGLGERMNESEGYPISMAFLRSTNSSSHIESLELRRLHRLSSQKKMFDIPLSRANYCRVLRQQHPVGPLLLRHIRKPHTRRVFLPRRQNPSNIQITHIDLFILLPFIPFLAIIIAALKHFQFRISIRRQKERQRIAFLARLIPDWMHRGRKLSVRLILEILPNVAYESTWLGWCLDPDAVLV
jgi:hypothetical protein